MSDGSPSSNNDEATFLAPLARLTIPHHGLEETTPPPDNLTLTPSESSNTLRFRTDYDKLLKEVLEEDDAMNDSTLMLNSDDSLYTSLHQFQDSFDIDLDTATADLPVDLRAALEDRSLADKYLANLKTFMSRQRSQSMGSMTSKGDYSSPTTPLQPTFSIQSPSGHPYRMQQDPLYKVLDAVPYQTRLINGVQSLWELQNKLVALKIPELDLPSVSDTVIKARLNDLYKVQDDLFIHLHGGPLVRNTHRLPIGEKKKREIDRLLDQVAKEIGLYEEFVKRDDYLCLESILNEPDSSDEDQDSDVYEIESTQSDTATAHPPSLPTLASFQKKPSTLRRVTSQPTLHAQSPLITPSNVRRYDSSSVGSIHSYDAVSDPSLSQLLADDEGGEKQDDITSEAFKWTPLVKISDHLYSKDVRRTSGLVSVLAVSGVIAVGTTRSLVYVYDYSQNLKCILGDTVRAVQVGAVTSVAISADHTTIVCGHSQGHIVVWDIRKPLHPIRTIEPIPPSQTLGSTPTTQPGASRKEGHVHGAAILHVGFIGIKKSEIVSGDDQGMAFYHVLYKVVMVNAVDTTRILGRYQNLSLPSSPSSTPPVSSPSISRLGSSSSLLDVPLSKPRRPSTVFAMQALPLGQFAHPAENFGLVALLTPYKMIIVGLKPSCQTKFKFLKPKLREPPTMEQQPSADENHANPEPSHENLSGCLAWLPVTKGPTATDKRPSTLEDPMLAYAWGNHLFILRTSVGLSEAQHSPSRFRGPMNGSSKRGTKLFFPKPAECQLEDSIIGLQWINRQILVLFTPNEEMLLFDPKKMMVTERASVRNKQLVYHDWFNAPLGDLDTKKRVEMAYYHSLKGYKGKLFLLGLDQIHVGTLLSWADRILALVRAGDILDAIQLCTAFYNGKWTRTVVGLPGDEAQRKQVVGKDLFGLLVSSLNYCFGSEDQVIDSNDILYQDLAKCTVDACLSMNNTQFLFDTAYEQFAEHDVQGVFLQVLETYIVSDQLRDLPPAVMKDLVTHYSTTGRLEALERIIWHVQPQCLDIDQIVGVCQRHGLYEAMMYVWNKSMDDFVSPLVEMLKVIRTSLKKSDNDGGGEMAAEKVFDYLKMVLQGRTFPEGTMMRTNRGNEARSAVYSFVFSGRCVVWPRLGGKLILTVDENESMAEPTYPYLRLLLRFNTKKFLDALESAFEDPWLNGGDDMLTSTFEEDVLQGKVISRQIIVNTLLDVMGGMNNSNPHLLAMPRLAPSFSASTVHSGINGNKGSGTSSETTSYYDGDSNHTAVIQNNHLLQLYIFIASNLHKYTTFILLPLTTKQKILTSLTVNDMSYPKQHRRVINDENTKEERQRAVQQLLTVYTPNNEEAMTSLYEEAKFWNVLEDVYRRDKKYGKLVETYLKDTTPPNEEEESSMERQHRVFNCVDWILDATSPLNDHQRLDVKRVVLIRISQFVDMDGQRTADLVEKHFGDHHDILRRLDEDDEEFDDEEEVYHDRVADKRVFSYLRGLLEPQPLDQVVEQVEEEEYVLLNGDEQDTLTGTKVSHHSPVLRRTNIDSKLQERYIDLMCRFDPSGVYDYLNTKLYDYGLDAAKKPTIDLSVLLKSCETYGVMDAAVWIMEKMGNIQGALDKMLEVGREKIQMILAIIKQQSWMFEDQVKISNGLIGLNGVLRVGICLCENSSSSSSTDCEIESLWFRLLDVYVEASMEIHSALKQPGVNLPVGIQHHLVQSVKSLVQSILTALLLSTSPQVSLPRLLLRLIDSQTKGETTFADFRDIFLSMLDTYKYEGQLLALTNRLFDRDLFLGVQDMVRQRGKGWRPLSMACAACGEGIIDLALMQPKLWAEQQEQGGPLLVFHCGHVFHRHCLDPPHLCTLCSVDKGKSKAT